MSALNLVAPAVPTPSLPRDLARAALAGAVLALLIVASVESHALCQLFCLHEALGAPMDPVLCTSAPRP